MYNAHFKSIVNYGGPNFFLSFFLSFFFIDSKPNYIHSPRIFKVFFCYRKKIKRTHNYDNACTQFTQNNDF